MKKIFFIQFLFFALILISVVDVCFAENLTAHEGWQQACMECSSNPNATSCVFDFKEKYSERNMFNLLASSYKGCFENFCVDQINQVYVLFGNPEPEVVVFSQDGKVLKTFKWTPENAQQYLIRVDELKNVLIFPYSVPNGTAFIYDDNGNKLDVFKISDPDKITSFSHSLIFFSKGKVLSANEQRGQANI